MRFRHLLSVGLLGLGLAVSPILAPSVRADDTPKEKPKGGDRPHGPQGYLDHFRATLDKLTLTSDQKTKVDGLFAEAKTKIDAAVKDGNGDKDATRAKVKPVFEELNKSVTALLTPDQVDQLKKLREEGKKKPAA